MSRTEETIRQHFIGESSKKEFKLYVADVTHAKLQKGIQRNMDIYQKRKQNANLGKNFVWT